MSDTDVLLAGVLALLAESKREHDHCDDSWYCCGACRHPDHMLVDGEHVGLIPVGGEPGACTCGAAEWNAKVDAALSIVPESDQ